MLRLIAGFALALQFTAVAVPAHAQTTAQPRLNDVTVSAEAETVTVRVKTSGPTAYQADLIESPDRLIIDLPDTTYAWRKTPLAVGAEPLRQIRGSQYKPGVSRLVVDLTRKVGYAVREEDNGIVISIPTAPLPGSVAGTAPATSRPATVAAPPAPKSVVKPALIAQVEGPRLAQAPAARAAFRPGHS